MNETFNLIRLAKQGGNYIIDAQNISTFNLLKIIKLVNENNNQLTIKNFKKIPQPDQLKIVKMGNHNVILDFTI